jgi:two-component sensor histidine kinase/PAS domain-containing protein
MSPFTLTVAHLLLALTCFAVAAALFILVRRKSREVYPYSRTAWLLIITFCASGLFHLITIPTEASAATEWAGILLAAGAAGACIALVANITSGRERTLFGELERQIKTTGAELQALLKEKSRLTGEIEASADELSQTTQRFETTLRRAPVFVSNQNPQLVYTWVRNPPNGYTVEQMLGHDDNAIFPGPLAQMLTSLKARTLATREHGRLEIELEGNDSPRWYEIGVDPMINQAGDVTGITTAAIDITHRKRNEAQLKLLLRDVTHRAKNVLAVVNAIARQTASRTATKDEFVERFSARVQSLARAHDLLVNEDWHGVKMSELVRSQLARYEKLLGKRILSDGPEVTLGPEATQNLGLAIHELAHNAGKYGALSDENGVVTIKWSVTGSGADRRFYFTWDEAGGPAVQDAQRIGFGRTFIERAVGRTLDGSATLEFRPHGVICKLEIPGYHLLRYEPGA